jgi:hypothetical protein
MPRDARAKAGHTVAKVRYAKENARTISAMREHDVLVSCCRSQFC